jgi:glycosyltransferase involved in cell wall biosynthesis
MPALLDVCDYGGPYAGNFIPSLLAVGDAVRERLDLDYVPVFSAIAMDKPWVESVLVRGYNPYFITGRPNLVNDVRSLHRLATDTGAVVIRSHFTRFDLSSGLVARSTGARSIWHVHAGLLQNTWKTQLASLVKMRALSRGLCDRVIAVSDQIGRESVARGHQPETVSVVRNGIDVSRFDHLPSRAAARERIGLTSEDRVALGFCWAPFRKGADLIAEACGRCDATAVLVGTEELDQFLAPLPSHVRVVRPVEDPGSLFAAADVFVSASREEGLPYAIGEAMAARLPVASSRIPGSSAYFAAPGLETFENEDIDGLVSVLTDLLQPEQRDVRGEQNRDFVSSQLGLDRYVDGIIDVLRRELDQRRTH